MHKKLMMVVTLVVLLPGLLQAFEYKGTRLYKEHPADEDISQFIRKSLQKSGELKELFALGEQDYKKFVDNNILQDYSSYFDGVSTGQGDRFYGKNADVGQEIDAIHNKAIAYISPLIREKFEPKLHQVLFDILHNPSKNIEKINRYEYHIVPSQDSSFSDKAADEILNDAVLHRKLHFQIYPVLEFMISTENYKPSVMQFIVDNFTITQKVAGIDTVDKNNSLQQTSLMKACKDISEQALLRVKFLIHCKADVNAQNRYGENSLMSACGNEGPQAFDMVQYLVEKGADVNAQMESAYTSLMSACGNEGPQAFNMVQYLVGKGAEVKAHRQSDSNSLVSASGNAGPQALNIVQYLVGKGADVNAPSRFGSTPLMCASVNEGPQAFSIVQYLVEQGADVNAQNQRQDTSLIFACQYRRLSIVQYLVEQGANVNVQNKYGQTALMFASQNGGPEGFNVVQYLLDHGADRNIRALSSWTAFEYAAYLPKIKDLLMNYQPKVL